MLKKKKNYTEIRALETVGGASRAGLEEETVALFKMFSEKLSSLPGFPIGILNCILVDFTNFYFFFLVLMV